MGLEGEEGQKRSQVFEATSLYAFDAELRRQEPAHGLQPGEGDALHASEDGGQTTGLP